MSRYCGLCRHNVTRFHLATASHRDRAYRASLVAGSGQAPRHINGARSLRDWDAQYSAEDPGNSAAWTAEWNLA